MAVTKTIKLYLVGIRLVDNNCSSTPKFGSTGYKEIKAKYGQ